MNDGLPLARTFPNFALVTFGDAALGLDLSGLPENAPRRFSGLPVNDPHRKYLPPSSRLRVGGSPMEHYSVSAVDEAETLSDLKTFLQQLKVDIADSSGNGKFCNRNVDDSFLNAFSEDDVSIPGFERFPGEQWKEILETTVTSKAQSL